MSFLVLRGRCRRCQRRINVRYPLIELLMASVVGLIAARYGLTLQALILVGLASCLLVAALVDSQQWLLPDQLLGLGAFVSVLGELVVGQANLSRLATEGIGGSWVIGGLLGFGMLGGLFVLTRGRGLGLGDVKLAAVLGLSLGGVGLLLTLGLAFVTGALVGVLGLITQRWTLKTAIPFGPFLIGAWTIVVLWGHELAPWYTTAIGL